MASNCSSCYPCGCFSPAPAPAGPTGPTGPTGPAAITAYGGLQTTNEWTVTLGETYMPVQMPAPMFSRNIEYDTSNSAVIINTAGDYEIIFSLNYQGGPIYPQMLEFAVLNGGTVIPHSTVAVTSNDDESGESIVRVTNAFIARLAAGDRLQLAARATGGSVDNELTDMGMTVKLLGEN